MALALAVPAQAFAAEIREQPADTVRTELARMEWAGGPAGEPVPEVHVEHRHGLWWVIEAQTGADNLLVEHEGDGVWSLRWQPTRYSPSGTYRIRVDGPDYALVSNDFAVRPCDCVIPGWLRSRWGAGRFRLRVTAEYAPASTGDFHLPAAPVRTGRPLVRVLRDGRRIGSVRMRYARGAFRGTWPGPRGPRHSVVFQLVWLADGFGNS